MAGCGAEITVVPPCDSDPSELRAVTEAAGHIESFRGRRRLLVTRRCAAITADLTGTDVHVQRALSQADAAAICADAKETIESRLDGGAELAAAIVDFGACYPFTEASDVCVADCGPSAICERACEAVAAFRAGCREPTIVVESSDDELGDAIETHFPPILALDLFVSRFAGDHKAPFDEAADALLDTLAGQRCASERAAIANRRADADRAYEELQNLLTFVRISRLTVIE